LNEHRPFQRDVALGHTNSNRASRALEKNVAFSSGISDDCRIRSQENKDEAGKSMAIQQNSSPHDSNRHMLRHALAAIAYRGSKSMRGATEEFARFRATESCRTPAELLAHLGDLMDWSLSQAQGAPKWQPAPVLPWDEGKARFFASLKSLDDFLATDAPLEFSAEKLLQGPVADALTHVGQLALLRRIAGAPVKAENYVAADIVTGRVGEDQAPPRKEF
jgi:hypothetical protein